MEFTGLPPATAQLAVELQLADVKQVMQGPISGDEYASFQAMQTKLQELLLRLEDQNFALDVLRADYGNRIVFQTLTREERQAEQDHRIACDLSGISPDQSERSAPTHHPEEQQAWLDDNCQSFYAPSASTLEENGFVATPGKDSAHSKGQVHQVAADAASDNAGPSCGYTSKGKGKTLNLPGGDEHVTHALCSVCMESCPRFDMIQLGCKRPEDAAYHAYCRSCLINLFQASLTDTTLFPPRCCGKNIPISSCLEFCPPAVEEQYREKQIELASPNPIFCSNRYCAKFIRPDYVTADVAICSSCLEETCTVCKNPRHKGLCPEDPSVQMLMDVAGQQRWQRCPRCRTMVELLMGCYHMRCRCGGEFCYLCAKPWKTCSCSQWDENRLLSNTQGAEAPANQIAMPEEEEILEADPSLDVLDDLQVRLATVAGGFAILDDDGDVDNDTGHLTGTCSHRWERAYGRSGALELCGICHDHLRFVNACTTCKTRVCNRCLNNRLF